MRAGLVLVAGMLMLALVGTADALTGPIYIILGDEIPQPPCLDGDLNKCIGWIASSVYYLAHP